MWPYNWMPHSILTIKLTWMINYHLRSISSCFVSFPENNTLEMISAPVSFENKIIWDFILKNELIFVLVMCKK